MPADSSHTLYLRDELRQMDPERFLTSLFAPRAQQPALWILYRLNAELFRISDLVTEYTLGQIRFQWWRDTIDRIQHQQPVLRPLAQGLASMAANDKRVIPLVHNLITVRMTELEEHPFATWTDVQKYLHGCATLDELAYHSVVQNDEAIARAVRMAGQVVAAHHLLRTALKRIARGHNILPQAEFPRHSISQNIEEACEALTPFVQRLCAECHAWLAEARALTKNLHRDYLALFLGVTIAERTLSILDRNGGWLNDGRLYIPQRRPIVMMWRYLKGRW